MSCDISANLLFIDECKICHTDCELEKECIQCKINGLIDIECNGNRLRLCNSDICKRCFEKSFASSNRAQYWSEKNKLKPREVFKSTHVKFLFECNVCDHIFETALNSVTNGNWCPYCVNIKLCNNSECKQCLRKSFASSDKARYWSEKNKLKPRDVFKKNNNKFWFICDCTHEFETSLNNIGKGNWCPYCSIPGKLLCSNNECKQCFKKSFASSDKVLYWSEKNKLKPRDVFKGNDNKFWFICDCTHEFEARLDNIGNGKWCPYCSIPSKLLCTNNECEQCFEKSFSSSDKARYWSEKNKLKPRDVFKNNNNKFWFDCGECIHKFEICLSGVTKGNWCSYCVNQKLCTNNECEKCFEKSFASSDKARYWSERNKLNPRDVFKSSGNKFWFKCEECSYKFESSLDQITRGTWCPVCKNKTEKKILDHCKTLHKTEHQFKPDWCKNSETDRHLPYDILLSDYKLIIECDGAQHFKDIKYWKSSSDDVQNRDLYKMRTANENGYHILRLNQEEVYRDKIDWKQKISDVIDEIKSGVSPSVWFYSSDISVYDNHDVLHIN